MNIGEKVAYLKGLADGSKLEDSNLAQLTKKIIDVLEDVAQSIDLIEDDVSELFEQVDAIDEDLDDLERDYYEEDDCCCEDDDCDCCDEDYYEAVCPQCGDTICLDEEKLMEGSINCPNCGEELEFEISCDCGEDSAKGGEDSKNNQ